MPVDWLMDKASLSLSLSSLNIKEGAMSGKEIFLEGAKSRRGILLEGESIFET